MCIYTRVRTYGRGTKLRFPYHNEMKKGQNGPGEFRCCGDITVCDQRSPPGVTVDLLGTTFCVREETRIDV